MDHSNLAPYNNTGMRTTQQHKRRITTPRKNTGTTPQRRTPQLPAAAIPYAGRTTGLQTIPDAIPPPRSTGTPTARRRVPDMAGRSALRRRVLRVPFKKGPEFAAAAVAAGIGLSHQVAQHEIHSRGIAHLYS